jgi:hypothetical protein
MSWFPFKSHAEAGAAGFSFTVVPTARPKRKSGRRKKNTYLALAAIFLIRHVETSR